MKDDATTNLSALRPDNVRPIIIDKDKFDPQLDEFELNWYINKMVDTEKEEFSKLSKNHPQSLVTNLSDNDIHIKRYDYIYSISAQSLAEFKDSKGKFAAILTNKVNTLVSNKYLITCNHVCPELGKTYYLLHPVPGKSEVHEIKVIVVETDKKLDYSICKIKEENEGHKKELLLKRSICFEKEFYKITPECTVEGRLIILKENFGKNVELGIVYPPGSLVKADLITNPAIAGISGGMTLSNKYLDTSLSIPNKFFGHYVGALTKERSFKCNGDSKSYKALSQGYKNLLDVNGDYEVY